MSPRAPRLCSYGVCHEIAEFRDRCGDHKRDDARERQLRGRQDNRPSASQRGYGAEWRKVRARVLHEEPTCRRCGGITKVVDHITPRTQGGSNDRDNLQGLCFTCHNRKTQMEDGGVVFGRRYDPA